MNNILALAIIPLICMGVTILTALVIIIALRRGTKGINEQAEKIISEKNQTPAGNTRWARGDLQGEARAPIVPQAAKHCPACGAENTANSAACAFCGRKF